MMQEIEGEIAGAVSYSQRRAWDPMHGWRTGLAGSIDSYPRTEQGSQRAWARKGANRDIQHGILQKSFPDCFVSSVKWEARSTGEHEHGEGDIRA